VLKLLGEGKSNREIARQLHFPAGTVSAHSAQIRRKLGLKSTNGLIRYAVC
jgi:two-component system, NarL family, nitrate/nitrite response regulator NarL